MQLPLRPMKTLLPESLRVPKTGGVNRATELRTFLSREVRTAMIILEANIVVVGMRLLR